MGDLGTDTAVEQVGPGRYRARLDRTWEIWGPMGGYVASVALRAVGAESPDTRPASFFCQYLGVAAFDAVDVAVTTVKAGRTVAFHRVSVTQENRPILEGTVCSVGDSADGPHALAHAEAVMPAVADPEDLPTIERLLPDGEPVFPFWASFDVHPIGFREDWPPSEPLPAEFQEWLRFRSVAAFDDPWIDACRGLVLVDIQSWPAAHRPHAWKQPPVYAPSLDLYVAFHEPGPWSDYLFVDGNSAVAGGGLMGWTGRLWNRERRLVASGGGQLLCRPLPG
jgi:acyl-CoA thioesterase-2